MSLWAAWRAAEAAQLPDGLRLHLSCSTSTGFRGVYENSGGRFEAVYIGVNGDVYVGVFETALSAAVAYARAVEAASVIAGGAAEPMVQAPMAAEETATPIAPAEQAAAAIAPAEQAAAAFEQPQVAPVTEAEGVRLHLSPRTSTGYRGVYQIIGGYKAVLELYGQKVLLGHFNSNMEAAVAYARAVAEEDFLPYAWPVREAAVTTRIWTFPAAGSLFGQPTVLTTVCRPRIGYGPPSLVDALLWEGAHAAGWRIRDYLEASAWLFVSPHGETYRMSAAPDADHAADDAVELSLLSELSVAEAAAPALEAADAGSEALTEADEESGGDEVPSVILKLAGFEAWAEARKQSLKYTCRFCGAGKLQPATKCPCYGGSLLPTVRKLEATELTWDQALGQCVRNPLCVRGFKHMGKGGKCRIVPMEDRVKREAEAEGRSAEEEKAPAEAKAVALAPDCPAAVAALEGVRVPREEQPAKGAKQYFEGGAFGCVLPASHAGPHEYAQPAKRARKNSWRAAEQEG